MKRSELMIWVSNDSKEINLNTVITRIGQSPQDAYRNYKNWRNKFIAGRPKATTKHTVEQLEEMGMVGLYKNETK